MGNVADVPGPGHYHATRSAGPRLQGLGSAFKSGTKRGMDALVGGSGGENGGDTGVGPAGLMVTKPGKSKQFHRADCHFFGST